MWMLRVIEYHLAQQHNVSTHLCAQHTLGSAVLGVEFGGDMAFVDQWKAVGEPKTLNKSAVAPMDEHGWPMSDFFQVRHIYHRSFSCSIRIAEGLLNYQSDASLV